MAAPVPLRVCLFNGASSLPIRIADHLGLLSAAGFATELHLTKGSKQLMEGLLDGRYDVVHAAPDNFIEWRDRTGADIVAWIGGTSGPLQLIGAPELLKVDDLAGHEIAVDSPTSGFVSVLRKILRAGGLATEEVTFVQRGSTQIRYEVLMSGETSADAGPALVCPGSRGRFPPSGGQRSGSSRDAGIVRSVARNVAGRAAQPGGCLSEGVVRRHHLAQPLRQSR